MNVKDRYVAQDLLVDTNSTRKEAIVSEKLKNHPPPNIIRLII